MIPPSIVVCTIKIYLIKDCVTPTFKRYFTQLFLCQILSGELLVEAGVVWPGDGTLVSPTYTYLHHEYIGIIMITAATVPLPG